MEPIVDQSLSDVFLGDSCFALDWSDIDDELMAAVTIAYMEDIVVGFQPFHDVVGVEDSCCCCLSELVT